mgnify:CR=1 FL=1
MKSKYVLLASALLISVATFAQKDQIKAAEKALKAGNAQEAITILQGAEAASAAAPDAEKAQFQFVKANAHLALATKNENTDDNLLAAAKAYQEVLSIEKTSGKAKFSAQASTSIIDVKYKLINAAIADSKAEKHAAGAKKLYDAYLLDKKDTINLYYAASTYVNAKEYETAYNAYDELKKLNYSGKGTNFYAVNKINGEEQFFPTAKERDQMVKLGTHEKPRTEDIPSKRGEIYKNIALINVNKGKNEDAIQAYSDARKVNPNDNSLLLNEANLYLTLKDFDMYTKLVNEALAKDPNNAEMLYNLGVISDTANKLDAAEGYYKKAIEIDPKYFNAYLNLAELKMRSDQKFVDEINKLGTSDKDLKRYEVVKADRNKNFLIILPILEKAVELDPTNDPAKKTLLSVYKALEMSDKVKELKSKM